MADDQSKRQRILIIGATSAIAKATARLYAEQAACLHLIGRNREALDALTADLAVRGAGEAAYNLLDANDFANHAATLQKAIDTLGGLDVVLICHGSLPDQRASELDFELTRQEINTNGLSVISMLTVLSQCLIEQRSGTLAVVTSVAGDRGRQSNFVYGAGKALVSTYLQGLRGRLYRHNVHVVEIRPGFVDSPMTAHLEKGPLWSSPSRIARIIVKSIESRRHTVYAPGYWRIIMLVVRALPDILFKHIRL